MRDRQEREIDYMRISITEHCNLRCRYCMPEGCEQTERPDYLSFEEICQIVRAGVQLGIVHYRLTGGEPFARKNCADLVAMIRSIPGVETIGLTTNGLLLSSQAEQLKAVGLDSVNISLDTVDAEDFAQLTGTDGLARVLDGINAARAAGLLVKLNAVSRKEMDWKGLLSYAAKVHLPLRFIELMPIGYGTACRGISNEELLEKMTKQYGIPEQLEKEPMQGHGPARYLRFPGHPEPVGLISALSGPFCEQCSRVRLSATGQLKLCLCYDIGMDLRPYLEDRELLRQKMEEAIFEKPALHHFEAKEQITEHRPMKDIGG